MPTPFYHLSVAEELLRHPPLAPIARCILEPQRGAFLLGHTAPDVQVVSGQPREATHFFVLPCRPKAPRPWAYLLETHPSLAHPEQLPPAQAAFLAGYLCHLQADWLWVKDIFAPVFGPTCWWGTFRQRLYWHNVLRAYLDRRVLPELPAAMGVWLGQTSPDRWLPFVQDRFLCEWRDFLASQLDPGAAVQTVEVLAARQGITPVEFYGLLDSEDRLEREIFVHLPRQQLEVYRQRLLADNVHLLQDYLASVCAAYPPAKIESFHYQRRVRDVL